MKNKNHSGVTIIELLVALAIGLVLSAAAAVVYQVVQTSTRNLESQALRNDIANSVFEVIGRDLKYAGYYPSHFPQELGSDNQNLRGQYVNIVNPAFVNSAFNQGIFGCSGAVVSSSTADCPPAAAGRPDSLMINYFADDTFTQRGQGLRRNCLGNDVERAQFNGVSYNLTRAGGDTSTYTTTVALPVLVSNIYSLSGLETATFYTDQTQTTRSLRCEGNQNPATLGGTSPQPMAMGVDQLTFRYGLFDPSLGYSPQQYYTAAEVSAIPLLTRTTRLGSLSMTGWQRVSSVQVCILTKTLDTIARQTADQGSYTDCYGATVSYTNADRAIYKRDIRNFAVRNHITTMLGN